ncbi:hypothetical protein [Acidovorax sp. sic0104]|uniref:hypothetical protein n=1 Tax=Acidovorax sp. sic0104 TaxID=2854784 RepID=UPI001C45CC3D|nr:hypothetical protein [Acidovorax sp. sic0104]MBV7544395.1 hypothetical protein [Acidovorax sp. sic0104]
MDVNSLEIGATYYRIAFADVAQTMPSIEPLVYAGVNIFNLPSGRSDKYYFQDAVSVVKFGLGIQLGQEVQPAAETSDLSPTSHEGRVYSAHEAREIGEVIVDLQALAIEINCTLKRAKELRFPKLSKAKGKWV